MFKNLLSVVKKPADKTLTDTRLEELRKENTELRARLSEKDREVLLLREVLAEIISAAKEGLGA